MDYFYRQTEIPLFAHELSFIIYNIYLSIGLALFIYSELRRYESGGKTELALITGGLFYIASNYIKLVSFISGLEALILLILYLKKKRGGVLFSSKLWALSLLLIFIGRLINLLDLIPQSYLSIIYFDLFAFTSIFILQLEAKIESRE
jgi:uncharacterized membrane protein